MHDRSAKFNIGLVSRASRLYQLDPTDAASVIDFWLRRFGDRVRSPRPGRASNVIIDFIMFKEGAEKGLIYANVPAIVVTIVKQREALSRSN
jgi:hypothetical protein